MYKRLLLPLVGIILVSMLSLGTPALSVTQFTTITDSQTDTANLITLTSPSNLYFTINGAGFVTLHWNDNSSNENGFIIERRGGNSTYRVIEKVTANTTAFDQNQLSTYPVSPGDEYYYRVKAFASRGSSGYSDELHIIVPDSTVPASPGGLKLESLPCQLKLTWEDRSENENGFEIEKKMEGGQYEKAGQTNNTDYLLNTAKWVGGARYTFRIKAYNGVGGSYSEEASLDFPDNAPSPASHLLVTSIIDGTRTNRLKLTWSDTSDNEDGFIILRKGENDEDFPPATNPTAIVGRNTTQYIDENLEYEKEYAYRVASFNLLGLGFSGTDKSATGPMAPELHAAAVSDKRVDLSWVLKSDLTSCRVERKASGEAEFRTIAYINTTEYSDYNVKPSETYTYRVGVFTGGFSWSTEVSVTVPGTAPNTLPVKTQQVIRLNLGQTTYTVNGEVRQMDTAPFIQEGRTLMPIRYVTEPLGATLDWDGTDQKVTVKLRDKTIELWIGKNTALVNGKEVLIDTGNPQVMPISVPPGRAMLPLRFISESLGCEVNWNQETQEASLTYN